MNQEKQQRFLELLAPVQKKLSDFCLAMTRNSDAAYDLMGDTVLAAYESFDRLKETQAFVSFLFTIARRKYWRRRIRTKLFGTYEPAVAEQIGDPGIRPWISVDIQALYDAIAKLPAKHREAIIMFEISGCSIEEIRQVQGGSISAIKSRLSRGRRQLAQLLGVDDDHLHLYGGDTGNHRHTDNQHQDNSDHSAAATDAPLHSTAIIHSR
jgi:RNA polymerase sigma-70 factor (ECF subfamily)